VGTLPVLRDDAVTQRVEELLGLVRLPDGRPRRPPLSVLTYPGHCDGLVSGGGALKIRKSAG